MFASPFFAPFPQKHAGPDLLQLKQGSSVGVMVTPTQVTLYINDVTETIYDRITTDQPLHVFVCMTDGAEEISIVPAGMKQCSEIRNNHPGMVLLCRGVSERLGDRSTPSSNFLILSVTSSTNMVMPVPKAI